MNFQYETNRLILKVLTPDAAGSILPFQLNNRDTFEAYDGQKPDNFYTLQGQKTFLTFEHQKMLDQKSFRYWIMDKEYPSAIIGTISIQHITRGMFQSCLLGYKMDQANSNKGYMTEALNFLLPRVFNDLQLHRIEAYVKPDNAPSIRVLEKTGFTQECLVKDALLLNGVWQDHLRFSLIPRP